AADPENLLLRARLIGRYGIALGRDTVREARRRHILWLIRHHPEAEIAGSPFSGLTTFFDGPAVREAEQLWREQVAAHPESPRVLGNAAQFLANRDPRAAAALLHQAETLDPENPRWPDQLAQLAALEMRRSRGAARAQAARQGFTAMERLARLGDA